MSKPTATVYAAYGQTVAGSTRVALDIVLSPPWVQVDVVGDPATPPDDRFELRTTDDDTYSQTVPAGGGVASEDRRLLRFVDLVPGRDYALLRHAPGADEPETVFWRRPYADLVNGTHSEADVTPAATFVAAQFVWEGGEATPLADRRLYLACERRHPAPDADEEDPADFVVKAYAVDGAGRYGRVSVWPDASTEQDSDAAPPERPADGGGGAAQDRVLLDLGADAWRAAVSEAPLSETEVATLWSELLDGPAEGGRRWTSFSPAPCVALPEPVAPVPFRIRIEPLPTRIYAPRIFGPPRPAPDPIVQISIEGGVADRARIEVYDGDRLVYAEEHTDRYVSAGEDVWAWDGVGDDGVFDTRRRLRVEAFLHRGGQVTKASQELRTTVGPMDWADLRFDRPARRIDVMFHVDVQNEGFADVTISLTGQPIPLTFGRKIPDAEFRRLKALVLAGISRHWSRTGNRALTGGLGSGTPDIYELHTTALERSREPSIDVDVYVNLNPVEARGSNTLLWDSSVFYNEAFFVSENVTAPRAQADANLALVAAHEIGHTVLYRTQGLRESITHQGTSTVLQTVRRNAPAPTGFDDDLMKYPIGQPSSTLVSKRDAEILCESFYLRVLAGHE